MAKRLQYSSVKVLNYEKFMKTDFTYGSIESITVDNQVICQESNIKYLTYIWELYCTNYFIMSNSDLHVKIGRHYYEGYTYSDRLGISYRSPSTKKVISELIKTFKMLNKKALIVFTKRNGRKIRYQT